MRYAFDMASVIDHFDVLTNHGLQVIPLHENSKIPISKGWTQNWCPKAAREKLLELPNCNIGLLLGNVVDVEGDSEEANRIVADLIGDYPHPSYQSTKSVHHLFQNPDPDLWHFRWEMIEFRGWGHQSVLPPSSHEGVQYRWLRNFKFPIPPMPERLAEFLRNKAKCKKTHSKTHRNLWCSLCRNKQSIHRGRFERELRVFKEMGLQWQCHRCRKIDLRPLCRTFKGPK